MLKCVAVYCSQGLGGKTRFENEVSMFWSVLQVAAMYCSVQQCDALSRAVAALYLSAACICCCVCCSVLQHDAVFCSVLQCVAVCCQFL